MSEAAGAVLTLTFEIRGETVFVLCGGRLMSSTAGVLVGPVSQLIADYERIVLDLAELTQMDSTGLGALVRLYCSARARGRVFELRNLGGKVRDLLILTNLVSVFSIVGERGVGPF